MLIECDACVMQGTSACGDCIVTVLLSGRLDEDAAGVRPVSVELDDGEAEALRHLADVGLVAPLRLVMRDRRTMDGTDGDLAAG